MKFIDTHCHIIPAVDDGPSDEATSLEMARVAQADGIGTIIATPHIVEGFYDGSDREERLSSLRKLLTEKGIELDLVAGAEVPTSACVAGDKASLADLTLAGGPYLLVETADMTFDLLSRAVYQVRLCGLYPVLAHPERAAFVQNAPQRLHETISGGEVYCQITANSFEGLFGKQVQKAANELLQGGLVHLIATDAHSPGRRDPRLAGCYRHLVDTVGQEVASVVMLENPGRILSGEKLVTTLVGDRRSARPGFFSRLLGR